MSAQVSDDKIQAVVSLVLQAVDQRLATVREQLVQLANHVARNHADLQGQINDIRSLSEASTSSQLLDVASMLADRVSSFEDRVTRYTDSRIAELTAIVDRIERSGATVGHPDHHAANGQPATADELPAALSRLGPLAATPRTVANGASGDTPVDVEALTAQVSERLSAAIERALGG